MTYRGQVKNGVVVFKDEVPFPEGAKVEVELVLDEAKPASNEKPKTLYERLKPVIGIAKGLPPDASRNHDHYLYGMPKK